MLKFQNTYLNVVIKLIKVQTIKNQLIRNQIYLNKRDNLLD